MTTRTARCGVLHCAAPPAREIAGRVLMCAVHADEYEEWAEDDWR